VIVIGEVVRLRDYLHPSDRPISIVSMSAISQSTMSDMSDMSRPLTGITVLVTRSAGQSTAFRDRLEAVGARVVEMPALEISPPSSWQELDRAIAQLDRYHWLILTSSNGVDYFCDRLLSQGKDTRDLAGLKIAVVGKKTAASLKQRGLQPDFIPPNFVADSLVSEFPEAVAGKNILFPRVESGGREVLVAEFTAAGAQVAEVAAYQSGCPKKINPAVANLLLQRQVDVITFASSKTVQYFSQLLSQELAAEYNQDLSTLLSNVCLASIGPQTSKTCLNLFDRVDIEAEEYTLDGLTEALVKWASRATSTPSTG
jgi:uroporphyrinogen III methyltransferase/synthase